MHETTNAQLLSEPNLYYIGVELMILFHLWNEIDLIKTQLTLRNVIDINRYAILFLL